MPTYSQEFPFGAPTVDGNSYTVDLMLNEPTRINRYLSDTMLVGYFAERIFPNGGGVSGGAVVYRQLTKNDLLPTRRSQIVAPGAEFPEVTFDRAEPKTAQVEKRGGKFKVTDEARDRNDLGELRAETFKLANDIQDQLHTQAIAELEASITAIGSDATLSANSWADATELTLSTENRAAMPSADFAALRRRARTIGLGTRYDLLVVNPQEAEAFEIIYGDRAPAVLRANGIEEMIVSNLVTAGSGYAVQEGGVGEVRYESPLNTITYREEGVESTWVKASVRHVFVVTDPYRVVKLTGLAA